MYNEKVMEVFRNPQHMGEVENYNAIGTVGNETCGDIMQITGGCDRTRRSAASEDSLFRACRRRNSRCNRRV